MAAQKPDAKSPNVNKIVTSITELRSEVAECISGIANIQGTIEKTSNAGSPNEISQIMQALSKQMSIESLEQNIKLDKILTSLGAGFDGKRGAVDSEYVTVIQQIKEILDNADLADSAKLDEIRTKIDIQPKPAPKKAAAKSTTTTTKYKTALTWMQAQWKAENIAVKSLFTEEQIKEAENHSTYKNAKTAASKINNLCKFLYEKVKDEETGKKIEQLWKE